MTIIQFRPSSWQDNNTEVNYTNNNHSYHIPEQECDCCEFVDYELPEEENKGFFSKLKGIFSKPTQPKNKLTNEAAYERARNVLCHSIVTRDEVATILEMTTSANKRQYLWKLIDAGIDVRFSEDELGRGIMLEKGLNGNLQRATTFIKSTHELVKIEERPQKGKGFNRISFFNSNGTDFEVKKNLTDEKTMKAFYKFENSTPVSYKRGGCKQTPDGIVGKEEYIF